MAEKVVLLEVEIDLDAAVKGSKVLAEEVAVLKAQTQKAKKEQGEFSKEFIQYNAALKSAQKEQRTQNNLIEKSISADVAKKGSVEQLRSQLSVVSTQWAKLSKNERENTDEGKKLAKQKLDLTNELKKEEKATGDARREVGNYTGGIKDATGAMGSFVPGAGAATSAARSLGVALKVMLGPIGLVIAAFAVVVGAIKAFFTSSEEGQNALKRLGAIFTTVFGNIIDLASKLGEVLVEAVTKPREAWDKFVGFIERVGAFFENTFGNIIGGAIQGFIARLLKGFAAVGLAWQKLKGIFVDNAEGIEKSQNKIADLNDRIEDSNERIKKGAQGLGNSIKSAWNTAREGLSDYIKEQEREIDIAQRLADQQAALDKQIRENLVTEAKRRTEISKIRVAAVDKENVSAEERLRLLNRAFEVEDEILQTNIDIAKQKFEIKKAQNELSNSTKEDLDEQFQLEAAIFKAQEQSFASRVRLQSQLSSVEREVLTEKKAAADEAIRILEEQIEKQKELEEEERDRKAEQAATDFENDFAIAEGNLLATLDLERQYLEQKRQQEIDAALKTGADINKINKKFAKAQRALDIAEVQAKLTLAGAATKGLAQIAGEQSAVGKAAAVASATISTIQGGISAFTGMVQSVPGPVGIALGAVAAAGVLASGYAQVKEILSVKSGLPGEGGGGGSIPSASAPNVAVPTARGSNVNPEVGAGIVSRQAEDASTQSVANGVSEALEANPLQPTLVEDDVTVKQDEASEQNQTAVL